MNVPVADVGLKIVILVAAQCTYLKIFGRVCFLTVFENKKLRGLRFIIIIYEY